MLDYKWLLKRFAQDMAPIQTTDAAVLATRQHGGCVAEAAATPEVGNDTYNSVCWTTLIEFPTYDRKD